MTKPSDNLIVIHHKQPFTNTLAIAEGVGIEHKNVIALVRRFNTDFEEFGILRFEIAKNRGNSAFQTRKSKDISGFQSRNSRGRETEYAELNEDQATYLITLFKNTETVRHFKIKLVKAFRAALKEVERLSKQASEPNWKLVRDETKLGFKWMTETLQEKRAAIGKQTNRLHYMTEAKLINAVLAGRFAGLDRNKLSSSELSLMGDLQRYNATLIAQDLPYPQRKTLLTDRATRKLTAH